MTCKNEHETHHTGCECHEARWEIKEREAYMRGYTDAMEAAVRRMRELFDRIGGVDESL